MLIQSDEHATRPLQAELAEIYTPWETLEELAE
jgi:hypothetical protein